MAKQTLTASDDQLKVIRDLSGLPFTQVKLFEFPVESNGIQNARLSTKLGFQNNFYPLMRASQGFSYMLDESWSEKKLIGGRMLAGFTLGLLKPLRVEMNNGKPRIVAGRKDKYQKIEKDNYGVVKNTVDRFSELDTAEFNDFVKSVVDILKKDHVIDLAKGIDLNQFEEV